MKLLLTLLITITLYSCSPRYGCGTENYRHRFRVEHIQKDRLGMWIVTLRNHRNDKRYMVCCTLPDSVQVGRWIDL